MQAKIKKPEKQFSPIELEIVIETKEELFALDKMLAKMRGCYELFEIIRNSTEEYKNES